MNEIKKNIKTDANCNLDDEICENKNRKKHKRSIDRKLFRIIREISHKTNFLMEPKGGQKRVLSIVYKEKKIAQNKLTRIVGITSASMSELINKLVYSNMVLRIPCESDKRTFIIKITKKGEEFMLKTFEKRNKNSHNMFSSLSDDEKEILTDLLTRLNEDREHRFSSQSEVNDKKEKSI